MALTKRTRLASVTLLLTVAGLLAMPALSIAQGDLMRVRDAVRNGSDDDDDDDDHHHRRRRHHHHHDHCDDDSGLDSAIGELIGYVITSPFWGPHAAVDQGYDVPGYFNSGPYSNGCCGLMQIGGYDQPPNHLTRFDVEYAFDFDDLERMGGRLLWEDTCRIGVDASLNYFQEDLPAGDDDLWLGDANAVFRFAQCETLVMRAGVGINWMADNQRGDAGINFTYGADWFPAEPLVFSTEFDVGTLGDAGLFHGRATVGVVRDQVEIYTGYDYYNVGGTGLGTFIAGLRVWF